MRTKVITQAQMFNQPCAGGYLFGYIIKNSAGKYERKERFVAEKSADAWRKYWEQWRIEDEWVDLITSEAITHGSPIVYDRYNAEIDCLPAARYAVGVFLESQKSG